MNICLFSIKLPILVKISFIVIEILTFNNNKWSSEVYHFHAEACFLTYVPFMELTLTPALTQLSH